MKTIKKDRKIKIFLGGYINKINAQNINCLALAKHLDKERFEVFTLTHHSNEISLDNIRNIHTFHCFFPRAFSKYLGFFWGIFHCDIAYLPKGEAWRWNRFWLKWFGTKSFATVESIIDKEVFPSACDNYGGKFALLEHFRSFDRLYSITHFMRKYNFDRLQLHSDDFILRLGTDSDFFFNGHKTIYAVNNVIMIGNDLIRKGVYDYFELAKMNPEIVFNLVGSGNGKINVENELKNQKINNVIYHGTLTPTGLKALLDTVQLNILPSRSEGFPKIVLETAAAGVPSFLYQDYGAAEWLHDGINGFLANNVSEINEKLQELAEDPEKLCEVSVNALSLAKQYDWKNIIKDWEKTIAEIV